LQSFFTGGGSAREHAVYPLEAVQLLAPVLHPPSVRIFEDESIFAFANPAAIRGPGSEIQASHPPSDDLSQGAVELRPRVAALVGAVSAIAGFTILAEWRDPARTPPKDRDFALGLGPYLATPDELDPTGLAALVRVDGEESFRGDVAAFDWEGARRQAADGTVLFPGDLLAAPAVGVVAEIEPGTTVEVELEGLGALRHLVHPEVEL
jgi:hypothetical protein